MSSVTRRDEAGESSQKRIRVSCWFQVEEGSCVHPFARWLLERAEQHNSAISTVKAIGGATWLRTTLRSCEHGKKDDPGGDSQEDMTENDAQMSLREFAMHPVFALRACEVVRIRCLQELQKSPPFPFSVWLEERMEKHARPRQLLKALNMLQSSVKHASDEERWNQLWHLAKQDDAWAKVAEHITSLVYPFRECIMAVTGVKEVARLIHKAQRILVLTGAGISVSCGIPTFREDGGLYQSIIQKFGFSSVDQVSDYNTFLKDPMPWFSMVKAMVPTESKAREVSITHRFIQLLEARGQLLHLFTQNIDALEVKAGISKLTCCHGSFQTATCTRCKSTEQGLSRVNEIIADGGIPYCQDRDCGGVMKPDVVLLNERLPINVVERIEESIASLDLLLVIGTSLSVAPCSDIPAKVGCSGEVPRILINMERVGRQYDFEGFLPGPCDETCGQLVKHLQYDFRKSKKTRGMRELSQSSTA